MSRISSRRLQFNSESRRISAPRVPPGSSACQAVNFVDPDGHKGTDHDESGGGRRSVVYTVCKAFVGASNSVEAAQARQQG